MHGFSGRANPWPQWAPATLSAASVLLLVFCCCVKLSQAQSSPVPSMNAANTTNNNTMLANMTLMTTTSTATTAPKPSNSSSDVSSSDIARAVVGGLFVFGGLAACIVCGGYCGYKWRKENAKEYRENVPKEYVFAVNPVNTETGSNIHDEGGPTAKEGGAGSVSPNAHDKEEAALTEEKSTLSLSQQQSEEATRSRGAPAANGDANSAPNHSNRTRSGSRSDRTTATSGASGEASASPSRPKASNAVDASSAPAATGAAEVIELSPAHLPGSNPAAHEKGSASPSNLAEVAELSETPIGLRPRTESEV